MRDQDWRPGDDTPQLDAAVFAIAEAVGAGELPAWRAEAMLQHVEQHEWLRDRGYVPAPAPPQPPAERPAELVAEEARIAARWRELEAQVRAGNPPDTDWIGLSEADRRLINHLHGYRPRAEREAESC
jgi:hypothetical protein